MEPQLDLAILIDRLQRLLRLDTTVFDEVRQDPTATVPAVLVVTSATFLSGIGGWIWWTVTKGFPHGGDVLFQSVIIGSLLSVTFWILWLFMSWTVLTQVFREDADWQQMLRTMGMAAFPLAISFAMFIPEIDFGIALASVALFFGMTTIAIQSTTSAGPARVLVANLAGFAIWASILTLLTTADSYLAPGIFLFDAVAEKVGAFSNFL